MYKIQKHRKYPVSMHVHSLSHIQLFATPRTVAHTLPMEFSRQEYWNGLPFLSPGDLPIAGTKPTYLASPALAGGWILYH